MTANIKFSLQPGGFERHLQRKYNNPLFSDVDQYLLPQEVERARERDRQDLQAFLSAFEEVVQRASQLSGSVDADVVLDLKQDLERLYVTSAGLAGDLDQYQDALQKLISVCMVTVEKGAVDDPEALQKLRDEAQAPGVFFALLKTPLVADILRGDDVIKSEELIPTLLSEPVENLPPVLELFEPDQITLLSKQAREFIDALPAPVRTQTDCNKQLDVLASATAEARG